MHIPSRRLWLVSAFFMALLSVAALLSLANGAVAETGDWQPVEGLTHWNVQLSARSSLATGASPTPTSTQIITKYLPILLSFGFPAVELEDAWVSNEQGIEKLAFLGSEVLIYRADLKNNLPTPVSATLVMSQTGPCNGALIFSDTLSLPAGSSHQLIPSQAQACTGIYTTAAELSHDALTSTLEARHIVITGQQGFDRCSLPAVNDMQTWWDASPYSVYNLYLGGVSFPSFCQPPNAQWVRQAAAQGWSFILTWVGPQAPCTSFKHRMSSKSKEAYQEGRDEAANAVSAALQLGFQDDLMIYYDIEAYGTASTSCRSTVSAFMRGWTEQLHALGAKAGGYGAGCSSNISDWASNDPPPDDVWIAHWYRKTYYPGAIVWDASCISNGLWSNQQRVKQYAGGHDESWGGVVMNIDSNAFERSPIRLPSASAAVVADQKTTVLETGAAPVKDFGLLSTSRGWAQVGERLLTTQDGGTSWHDITPASFSVLGAAYRSWQQGWIVGWSHPTAQLQVGRTIEGGSSWDFSALPVAATEGDPQVEAAYLSPVDEATAWVALRLQSGSSFSLGRLFVTRDGGLTWQERNIPLGEPVVFQDALRGWTAGGPAGNQLYLTQDGGFTWQAAPAAASQLGDNGLPRSALALGIPGSAMSVDFLDDRQGWVLVQSGSCQEQADIAAAGGALFRCQQRWRLLATTDGGSSWRAITPGD